MWKESTGPLTSQYGLFRKPKCIFCGGRLKCKRDAHERIINSPNDSAWGFTELKKRSLGRFTARLTRYPYVVQYYYFTWRCLECGALYTEDDLLCYDELLAKTDKMRRRINKKFPSVSFNVKFEYEDGKPYDPKNKLFFDKVIIELKTEKKYWSEVCFVTKVYYFHSSEFTFYTLEYHHFEPTQHWENVDFVSLCRALIE